MNMKGSPDRPRPVKGEKINNEKTSGVRRLAFEAGSRPPFVSVSRDWFLGGELLGRFFEIIELLIRRTSTMFSCDKLSKYLSREFVTGDHLLCIRIWIKLKRGASNSRKPLQKRSTVFRSYWHAAGKLHNNNQPYLCLALSICERNHDPNRTKHKVRWMALTWDWAVCVRVLVLGDKIRRKSTFRWGREKHSNWPKTCWLAWGRIGNTRSARKKAGCCQVKNGIKRILHPITGSDRGSSPGTKGTELFIHFMSRWEMALRFRKHGRCGCAVNWRKTTYWWQGEMGKRFNNGATSLQSGRKRGDRMWKQLILW